MNIKEAKEQIKYALMAYFSKNEYGNYKIPLEKQRPIFLLGAPGIGKTAIMEQIAQELGVPETVIALTFVALGTSLPELVTSIVAAKKGESDIAVGNVVGSNIFNILLILGTSATVLPMNVSTTYIYDIGILLAISIVFFIPIAIKKKIGRGLGIMMLLTYALYTTYLILRQLGKI